MGLEEKIDELNNQIHEVEKELLELRQYVASLERQLIYGKNNE